MSYITVEVNFMTVHTDNYQGGCGKSYAESVLMELPYKFELGEVLKEAQTRLNDMQPQNYRMENIRIKNIVIKNVI